MGISEDFERWMARTTFPDGTMPVDAMTKLLMAMAYQAGLRRLGGEKSDEVEQVSALIEMPNQTLIPGDLP